MASALKNLSNYNDSNIPDGSSFNIAIIVAEWNTEITHKIHKNCVDTLVKHGVSQERIIVHQVPGTFEIPVAAKWAITNENLDAIIGLGCVIKGETKHDNYINHATAQAMQNLSLETSKPCIFGIVTTNNLQQAIDRSGGIHGNKGVEAAITALRMIALNKSMKGQSGSIGF